MISIVKRKSPSKRTRRVNSPPQHIPLRPPILSYVRPSGSRPGISSLLRYPRTEWTTYRTKETVVYLGSARSRRKRVITHPQLRVFIGTRHYPPSSNRQVLGLKSGTIEHLLVRVCRQRLWLRLTSLLFL